MLENELRKMHILILSLTILILGISIGKQIYDKVLEDKDVKKNKTKIEEQSKATKDYDVLSQDQKVNEVKDYKNVIEIPSLGVLAPIAEGTDLQTLKYNVGHFKETAGIGELGNCAIAGHSSSVYNCIFNTLDTLKPTEEINMYNKDGTKFTYYCINSKVIEPYDTNVLNDFGDTRLTIITCAENGSKRLCLTAEILTKEDLEKLKKELSKGRVKVMKNIINDYNNITTSKYLGGNDD